MYVGPIKCWHSVNIDQIMINEVRKYRLVACSKQCDACKSANILHGTSNIGIFSCFSTKDPNHDNLIEHDWDQI